MMFRIEVHFGVAKRKTHEYVQDFEDLNEEGIMKSTAWFRSLIEAHNMRGVAFIILPNGEEFDMTFNKIDPKRRCSLSGIEVPADVYRAKTLVNCFHTTLTALKLEYCT